jgi:hypothetical protein
MTKLVDPTLYEIISFINEAIIPWEFDMARRYPAENKTLIKIALYTPRMDIEIAKTIVEKNKTNSKSEKQQIAK